MTGLLTTRRSVEEQEYDLGPTLRVIASRSGWSGGEGRWTAAVQRREGRDKHFYWSTISVVIGTSLEGVREAVLADLAAMRAELDAVLGPPDVLGGDQ